MLPRLKKQFLAKLATFGLEDNIIVAKVRKSKPGRVAYYCGMSQFRNKPRLVIDVEAIAAEYVSAALIEEEVLMSISHEYGHCIAECIRETPRISRGGDVFIGLPDWKPVFDSDEEYFAEDFARFMVTYDARQEPFWDDFMPKYIAEFKRIYMEA
ncbi:uncharacterized protein NMK_2065 [Novimethylophilus kurashikiensis]|uniref:Uncharacterized protein n=1 Tax=Novimethylophilus kurashikiensis TaxID=1825523 RepID=A0A2R5F8C0_9PROT|nr:hypothetical protein [Novimethylophilus kurashikiensis]GBG14466.1 uncharacterized protein NMK_2065 [Novimethylophilus kurashikiensis]